jgi:hypothetical protein
MSPVRASRMNSGKWDEQRFVTFMSALVTMTKQFKKDGGGGFDIPPSAKPWPSSFAPGKLLPHMSSMKYRDGIDCVAHIQPAAWQAAGLGHCRTVCLYDIVHV